MASTSPSQLHQSEVKPLFRQSARLYNQNERTRRKWTTCFSQKGMGNLAGSTVPSPSQTKLTNSKLPIVPYSKSKLPIKQRAEWQHTPQTTNGLPMSTVDYQQESTNTVSSSYLAGALPMVRTMTSCRKAVESLPSSNLGLATRPSAVKIQSHTTLQQKHD